MKKIHYFQRYGGKENWATNSTLLLLSRLYHHSPLKFEKVINAILEESQLSLNIGVNFGQQEKVKNSVVDGVISQESFKVVIETKLYDNFSADQLLRHLEALKDISGQRVLLALSKHKITAKVREEVQDKLRDQDFENIKFASSTYQNIIDAIQAVLSDYDVELTEILEDYTELCEEHDLIDLANHTMLVVTATNSLEDNKRFGIYYDPATRSHNLPFNYIGLYYEKAVVAIGKVSKTVFCDYENGKLQLLNSSPKLNEDEIRRISEIIENTKYYNLQKGTRFFLVEKFYPTDFRITSFASIRSKRYCDLQESITDFSDKTSAEDIAKMLDGKEW